MGIDTVIDYPCIPKDILTTAGLMERLKSRERAQAVIKVYRDQGDFRSEMDIGFEVSHRAADGSIVAESLVAGEVLVDTEILAELAPHCVGCPANLNRDAFGCIMTINFPISEAAEIWLLKRLPAAGTPLLQLLKRGVEEYGYDGEAIRQLRNHPGVYFESEEALGRPYVDEDLIVTTDMLFEMMFTVGPVQPAHAAMLMLFLDVIPRDQLTPEELFWLMNGQTVENIPLLLGHEDDDNASIRDFKNFFYALYNAYLLNVPMLIDL